MEESVRILIKSAPNKTIMKSILKTYNVLNHRGYKNVMVSISGGSDSDIVLGLCTKLDFKNICRYVWFNTGMEYEATKRHINFLREWYGVEIEENRPDKNIIQATREFGQPFVSKYVSDMVSRLQKRNFEWEDMDYEELHEIYERVENGIKWWSNYYFRLCKNSYFNIDRNRYLREFMIENNPWFEISDKCCKYAKKEVSKNYIKDHNIQLNIMGVRSAEGGIRKSTYKSCFMERKNEVDLFLPILWYSDHDKELYCENYEVEHSDCYKLYGFRRTGCAGCPFGGIKNVNHELKVIKEQEPNLYKTCWNVFGESYKYMRMYKDYCDKMRNKPLDKIKKSSPNYREV